MDCTQPIGASMFGGPLARLVSHAWEHPGLMPEWALAELELLTSVELLLMAKATFVLERAGVPIDAGLLADASKVTSRQDPAISRLLALLDQPE